MKSPLKELIIINYKTWIINQRGGAVGGVAFAGGGGTLSMANKNGRIFIGIDQSEISLSVIKENLTKASYDEINLSHLSN